MKRLLDVVMHRIHVNDVNSNLCIFVIVLRMSGQVDIFTYTCYFVYYLLDMNIIAVLYKFEAATVCHCKMYLSCVHLKEQHHVYCQKVDEIKAIQKKCMSSIAHQRYRTKHISDTLRKYESVFIVFDSVECAQCFPTYLM